MFRLMAIPLVMLALLTTACQTSMLKQFQEVKPGMEKDDVLELMGSPQQTQRFHDKDRWYYVFYDKHIRFEKEVQFFEGNAVYVGDTWQPPEEKSAFVADKNNTLRDKALDEQVAKEISQMRTNYEAFEKQAHGTDKVRYVPTFVPIR